MDIGSFNLFLKLVQDDYKLNEAQLLIIRYRLMADDKEFEQVWRSYKDKSRLTKLGVDPFRPLLHDLLT